MNNPQNVSKAEWLCAALIDFLPIAILGCLRGVANLILFRAARNINIHIIDITDLTIYIIFFWGAAL